MKTEAKITIKEIRAALSADVALGKMSQETADQVKRLLNLGWREKQHNHRNDMECFFEDLRELFEAYDAKLVSGGTYTVEIWINKSKMRIRFDSPTFFDKDFIALLPKMYERGGLVNTLEITGATTLEELLPILEAAEKVDCKAQDYVSDEKFNEMIKNFQQR